MTTQEIQNAGRYLFRATEEVINFNSEDPWGCIEEPLKELMMSKESLPAMERLNQMCDGLIWSMNFEADRAKNGDPCYAMVADKEGKMHLAMMAVTSTFALRMFALGVQAQKTASEVAKLEALLGSD